MHKLVNGSRVELTTTESDALRAEWAAVAAEKIVAQTTRDAATARKDARLADVPVDADLAQLRTIVQGLINEMRGT